MERIKRFFKEEEGVTALEYGVIASMTVLAIVGVGAAIFGGLENLYTEITAALNPGFGS